MPTQNVNLSEQQAKFIREKVNEGGFRNASEVVRAALRLLKQQQEMDRLKLKTLRKLSKQALSQIDAGDYELIGADEVDSFIDRISASPAKAR